jgi:selenide,water dikinase
MAKGGLTPGDVLILTKPIGTGILFAGWMRGLARAREIAAALAVMRRTNTAAAAAFVDAGARAATDVTGFGLAGHLLEMLEAAQMSASLALDACPRYCGVDRLIEAGVRSSLLADNLARSDRIDLGAGLGEAALALLFDPQTSGGLLAGVPEARAEACLAALAATGVEAVAIGRVMGAGEGPAGRLSVIAENTEPSLARGRHRPAAAKPITAQ